VLVIARVYHWVARVGNKMCISLDKIVGGEEAEEDWKSEKQKE
jgi:hypothetical protein